MERRAKILLLNMDEVEHWTHKSSDSSTDNQDNKHFT